MKIDTDDYCTMEEFQAAIGCSRRASFRIRAKAIANGLDSAFAKLFGKMLVVRARIGELKQFYEPFGSDARHEGAVRYGKRGGTQKRINRERAARAAKRVRG